MAETFVAEKGTQVKNLKTGDVTDVGVQSSFASGAFEAVQPVAPVAPDVLPEAPAALKTSELATKPTDVEQLNKGRNDMLKRVQDSYNKVNGQHPSNEAFIQGAAQAKFGRAATAEELQMSGQPLDTVLKNIGLDLQMPDFGLKKEEVVQVDTPTGTAEVTQTTTPTETTTTGEVVAEPQTAMEKLIAETKKLAGTKGDAKTAAQEKFGVEAKSQKITQVQNELNDLRTSLQNEGILDIKELDAIADKPITNAGIARQQATLSREQKLDMMIMQNNYNNKQVELQIANGDYDRAREMVQETADDAYENGLLMLEALQLEVGMEEAEDARMREELAFDRELALGGYVQLTDPAEIAKIGTNQTYRDPITGKTYMRPPAEEVQRNTQIVDIGNRKVLLDTQTGETIKDLGTSFTAAQLLEDVGTTTTGAGLEGLSDGRSTNAFGTGTVTGIDGSQLWKYGLDFVLDGGKGAEVKAPFGGEVIAVENGFINDTGKPLTSSEGKSQNGGFGNQVKIRLDDGSEMWISHLDSVGNINIGDVLQTGDIIGTQGNTGSTYGNTGVHLDVTMKNPNGDFFEARQVSALLNDNRLQKTYEDNIEFGYNEKIETNRLPKLGGKVITDKTARSSNLPFGITTEQANWIMERRPGNIEFQRLATKDYQSLIDLLELRDDIVQITELKKKINTGPVISRSARAERFVGLSGDDIDNFTKLEIKTGKQLAEYIKEISGAAVSEQEAQRLARNIPHVSMQDGQFKIALEDFQDDLNAVISGVLNKYDIEDENRLKSILGDVSGEITGEDPAGLSNSNNTNNNPMGLDL